MTAIGCMVGGSNPKSNCPHIQLSRHNTLNPMWLTIGLLVPCMVPANQCCVTGWIRGFEKHCEVVEVVKCAGQDETEWLIERTGTTSQVTRLVFDGPRGQMFTCWSHFGQCTFIVMAYSRVPVPLASCCLDHCSLVPLKTEHETPRCGTAYMENHKIVPLLDSWWLEALVFLFQTP